MEQMAATAAVLAEVRVIPILKNAIYVIEQREEADINPH